MKRLIRFKIVQLTLLILAVIVFAMMLFTNYDLRLRIYNDSGILFLCAFIWFLFAYCTISIIVDITLLFSLQKESGSIDRAAYADALTSLPNRYSFDMYLEQMRSSRAAAELGCITVEIINLQHINSTRGADTGNLILTQFASAVLKATEDGGYAARTGNERFSIILQNCTRERVMEYITQLDFTLAAQSAITSNNDFSYRYGYALNSEEHCAALTELASIATSRLLEDK